MIYSSHDEKLFEDAGPSLNLALYSEQNLK